MGTGRAGARHLGIELSMFQTEKVKLLMVGSFIARRSLRISQRQTLAYSNVIAGNSSETRRLLLDSLRGLLVAGKTMQKFEQALDAIGPYELRKLVKQDRIERGAVLWQGRKGLCVAAESCLRSESGNTTVYCLQNQTAAPFQKGFLIPLEALLAMPEMKLTVAEVASFRKFVDRFKKVGSS